MNKLADFMIRNYFEKTKQKMDIPPVAVLVKALDLNEDKIIVVHEGDEIKGAAIFLTLTDESLAKIHDFSFFSVETLRDLLSEKGPNIHFIMVAANGSKMIKNGIRAVIREREPKTISWWDPDNKRLHKYSLN